ncbi:MAG: MinD/ParA family protein [Desulfarculaceae bacterium]
MDQAQTLRRMAAKKKTASISGPPLRTLAVTSGKGGVGKTNLVVNLALELSRMGRKVLIIDADLGLANVDVVLGLNPKYTLADVIHGGKELSEVVLEGPGGIQILPGASGVSELAALSGDEKLMILQELDGFETRADTVIIDTAAGISDMVLYFNIAAQERIVVATDEPTSLTDAYAMIKVLMTRHQERRFKLVVNNVREAAQAKNVYRKLGAAVDHFLGGVSLDYLGFIPSDPAVNQSVMQQKPLVQAFPNSPAARAIKGLAKTLLAQPVDVAGGNIKFFWRRLVDMA